MRMKHVQQLLIVLSLPFAMSASGGPNDPVAEFPSKVAFEIGAVEFAPGDSITIQQVRGTSPTIRTGETYCVEGTYTLASREQADVALYATTTTTVTAQIDASQITRIGKGTGTFRLVKTMREEGYLHISLYSVTDGNGFGGVYFGQGNWVLKNKGWSYLDTRSRAADAITSGNSTGGLVSVSGQNRVLLEYLGDPVSPPADMDPAYSRAGLTNAVETAARKAGVSVKRIEIDDSEFPFLVGVICKEGDCAKLTGQFQDMPAYSYGGSTSTQTHSVFNLVPYRVLASPVGKRITHRTGLRSQVFLDKLLSLE